MSRTSIGRLPGRMEGTIITSFADLADKLPPLEGGAESAFWELAVLFSFPKGVYSGMIIGPFVGFWFVSTLSRVLDRVLGFAMVEDLPPKGMEEVFLLATRCIYPARLLS